jgi:hypothetical protein
VQVIIIPIELETNSQSKRSILWDKFTMPMIISTPEEWFRDQRRDLYLIVLNENHGKFSKKKNMANQKLLNKWFDEHLPNTPLRIIGSSENSGWITGGPCYFTADFDANTLAIFNAAWEPESAWKIEVWSFDEWRERVESVNLITSPGLEYKKVRWWDTSRGILILNGITQGRFVGGNEKTGEIHLTLRDGWWRLQQHFPEFSEYRADKFPSGVFWPHANSGNKSFLILDWTCHAEWKPEDYVKDVQKIQNLKKAIGIPEDMPIEIYESDI